MRVWNTFSSLIHLLTYALLQTASIHAFANIEIGEEVDLGESLGALLPKIDGYCQSVSLIAVDKPRFPLSASSEEHLICHGYEKEGLAAGKLAFTVSDGRLVHMEAVQINTEEARAQLGRSLGSYSGIEIFGFGTHWLNESSGSLAWITAEGRHLNLFAWHNPFLDDETYSYQQLEIDLPQVVDFSRSLSEHEIELRELCEPILIEDEDEIWLPNAPTTQVQVNCYNYEYAGFERKLELVYGDNKLEVVWVLTAKPEEQRLRELLVESLGDPIINNDTWEVFGDGRISLRKDTPELLILSDDMIPQYMERFVSEVLE